MSAVVHLLHPWWFGGGVGRRLETPRLGTGTCIDVKRFFAVRI